MVLHGAGLSFGSYLAGSVLVVLIAQILVLAGIPVFDKPALLLGLSVVLLQGVAFGGGALVYLRTQGLGLEFVSVSVPSRRDIMWTFGGFGALLGSLGVFTAAFSYFGIESARNQIVELGSQQPSVFLALVPASLLLVGPGEELLYRGTIQERLAEVFSVRQAIVIASAIFAVIHIFSLQGTGKIVYLGVVFVLALILGITYEYTENLVVPALIHGGYNAVQFGAVYYTVTL